VPFLIVDSDWRANSPPTPTISPNTSNRNLEIAILFSIVDFQIENMILRRTLPHKPQGKGFKLCPGAYKVFIENVVVETSKQAHSIGNSKG
jgi:hypothetical protein